MRTGCHYLISLSVCQCVTLVVFADCESCTRPISTNSGSMEAGEYGLTRGTCSSHAVTSWTPSPGCCGFRGVFRVGRIFFSVFFFRFFLLRTHTACCRYEATLPYVPLYEYLPAPTFCRKRAWNLSRIIVFGVMFVCMKRYA